MTALAHHTSRVERFVHFTADDYRAMAQACRVTEAQAKADALAQQNPDVVKTFSDKARRFRELAVKCDLAARVL